jgi:hypothetical protein
MAEVTSMLKIKAAAYSEKRESQSEGYTVS